MDETKPEPTPEQQEEKTKDNIPSFPPPRIQSDLEERPESLPEFEEKLKYLCGKTKIRGCFVRLVYESHPEKEAYGIKAFVQGDAEISTVVNRALKIYFALSQATIDALEKEKDQGLAEEAAEAEAQGGEDGV